MGTSSLPSKPFTMGTGALEPEAKVSMSLDDLIARNKKKNPKTGSSAGKQGGATRRQGQVVTAVSKANQNRASAQRQPKLAEKRGLGKGAVQTAKKGAQAAAMAPRVLVVRRPLGQPGPRGWSRAQPGGGAGVRIRVNGRGGGSTSRARIIMPGTPAAMQAAKISIPNKQFAGMPPHRQPQVLQQQAGQAVMYAPGIMMPGQQAVRSAPQQAFAAPAPALDYSRQHFNSAPPEPNPAANILIDTYRQPGIAEDETVDEYEPAPMHVEAQVPYMPNEAAQGFALAGGSQQQALVQQRHQQRHAGDLDPAYTLRGQGMVPQAQYGGAPARRYATQGGQDVLYNGLRRR